MRGALQPLEGLCFRDGIIPAYAGSTSAGQRRRRRRGDHPRVCGEHRMSPRSAATGLGSSPRMRGARRLGPDRGQGRRIIPAYAGSTGGTEEGVGLARDHPRVCGEHMSVDLYAHQPMGSSPRMRGARRRVGAHPESDGIIPAYAGSTAGTPSRRTDSEDHPRVCGEHCVNLLADYNAKGSSPRMRGALGRRPLWKVYPGIIPAYAGSTQGR